MMMMIAKENKERICIHCQHKVLWPVTRQTPSSGHGRRPTTNETATVLTTAKISSRVPEGLNAKADWLTDRQLQSDSDSDCVECHSSC
jgi:hypothetical protein